MIMYVGTRLVITNKTDEAINYFRVSERKVCNGKWVRREWEKNHRFLK